MNVPELREILAGCPEAECKNKEILGWLGALGFVCAHCAARLLARGCGDPKILHSPRWVGDEPAPDCVLCGKAVAQ